MSLPHLFDYCSFGSKFWGFLKIFICFYWAALGLSCGKQDLRRVMQGPLLQSTGISGFGA